MEIISMGGQFSLGVYNHIPPDNRKNSRYPWSLKAIPVKSPMNIVYRSESEEAVKILDKIGIKPPNRILVGALPKIG